MEQEDAALERPGLPAKTNDGVELRDDGLGPPAFRVGRWQEAGLEQALEHVFGHLASPVAQERLTDLAGHSWVVLGTEQIVN